MKGKRIESAPNAPLLEKPSKPPKAKFGRGLLPPLHFAFVSWPAALSDIPKGLLSSLSGGLAMNSQPRGFATWGTEMAASGAEMHPQLEMSSNGMAAVDAQAMTEITVATHFGKMVEL